jgi:hypothetical protein
VTLSADDISEDCIRFHNHTVVTLPQFWPHSRAYRVWLNYLKAYQHTELSLEDIAAIWWFDNTFEFSSERTTP